ncbi:hypothetical protein CYMTET_42560 [Cymbomonas tetramitiformis]|uniref:ATP-dependent 6-phosphofructokinase n=1 Tax=Cymbomonas tetramitiformis TaxID=36881 RepID=A0AAE0F0V0_9CHLO|nr:hypothetical protein CYMTET_42560 [Cymbomonas tetramitiformis]
MGFPRRPTVVVYNKSGNGNGDAATSPQKSTKTVEDTVVFPADDDNLCVVDPLCGGTLMKAQHLGDFMKLPKYNNPMLDDEAYGAVGHFIDPDDVVPQTVVHNINKPLSTNLFLRAGPRAQVHFHPNEVKAAIVTCGGLCPGLNTVIREVVMTLWGRYGVRKILGVKNGYRGFYAENLIELNPEVVDGIHRRGGTMLGTSRGGSVTAKIVDAIEYRGINHVYIIGGDGTQKGALAIHEEARKRGIKLAVAGIPKTIDNDVDIIDRSFGFDTAVEEAQHAINAAHVEATSTPLGVGLVKVMGRHAGFIAMHSTLSSRDVDLCLIPEVPFFMDGPGGVIEYIESKLALNNHVVIVIAEGAGQEQVQSHVSGTDASGNKLLADCGLWLATDMKEKFKARGQEICLKYIDPTYMIRAVPSNAADNVYCTVLAQAAVHAAFAGYTGFMVGPVNGRHAIIPIDVATQTSSSVNPQDRMWARLMASNGQPSFAKKGGVQKKK